MLPTLDLVLDQLLLLLVLLDSTYHLELVSLVSLLEVPTTELLLVPAQQST